MNARMGILILVLCVGLAIVFGVVAWQAVGPVEIGAAGWIAIVLGMIGTAGLGGGLMALVFYSARKGYDDDVGH